MKTMHTKHFNSKVTFGSYFKKFQKIEFTLQDIEEFVLDLLLKEKLKPNA